VVKESTKKEPPRADCAENGELQEKTTRQKSTEELSSHNRGKQESPKGTALLWEWGGKNGGKNVQAWRLKMVTKISNNKKHLINGDEQSLSEGGEIRDSDQAPRTGAKQGSVNVTIQSE